MTGFQQHLVQHWQARIQDEHCFFSNEDDLDKLSTQTVITPLLQYGLVAVEGPDAQTFLQGQTSCDFRHIDTSHSAPGAYCTPKGRMLASFHAGALAIDHYLLRLRRDLVDNTLAVLGKYVVFSKAELKDESDTRVALGISGEQARGLLSKHFASLPSERFQSCLDRDTLILQLDEAGQRFECWLPAEQAPALWDKLAAAAKPAPSTLWDLLNIRAGVADISAATCETFVPQVINYELTGGINFKKGCYTGQEVVARLHYRGQSKRRMFCATLDAQAPTAGSDLYTEDKTTSIGHVVMAVDTGKHSELLVSVTLEAAEAGHIHLQDSSHTLSLKPPPYPLDEKKIN